MAETGKKAADHTVATQGPPANQAVDAVATDAVSNPDVPETPQENSRASHRVYCNWPISSFIVSSNVPEIFSTGTLLTKSQLAEAEASAAASGVSLTVEEVK